MAVPTIPALPASTLPGLPKLPVPAIPTPIIPNLTGTAPAPGTPSNYHLDSDQFFTWGTANQYRTGHVSGGDSWELQRDVGGGSYTARIRAVEGATPTVSFPGSDVQVATGKHLLAEGAGSNVGSAAQPFSTIYGTNVQASYLKATSAIQLYGSDLAFRTVLSLTSDNLLVAAPSGPGPAKDTIVEGYQVSFRAPSGPTTRAKFDASGHFIPGTDNTYNLGEVATRWANVYATSFTGSGTSLTGVGLLADDNVWTLGPNTFNTGGTGNVAIIAKGAASQTANLQEWQDSTGAVLASIASSGTLTEFRNGLGSVSTTTDIRSIVVANTTAGTAGTPFQDSPSIELHGHSYTTFGTTDRDHKWRIFVKGSNSGAYADLGYLTIQSWHPTTSDWRNRLELQSTDIQYGTPGHARLWMYLQVNGELYVRSGYALRMTDTGNVDLAVMIRSATVTNALDIHSLAAAPTPVRFLGNHSTGFTQIIARDALFQRDAIGSTSSDGCVLENTTAATSGNQQWSPRVRWSGRGWKTNPTAASQAVDWIAQAVPIEGAANPTSEWRLSSSVNGGSYSYRMFVSEETSPSNTTDVSPGSISARAIYARRWTSNSEAASGFRFQDSGYPTNSGMFDNGSIVTINTGADGVIGFSVDGPSDPTTGLDFHAAAIGSYPPTQNSEDLQTDGCLYINNVMPPNDNQGYVGNDTYRWSQVRAVEIVAGDLCWDDERCRICGLQFEAGDDVVFRVIDVVEDAMRRRVSHSVPIHLQCKERAHA